MYLRVEAKMGSDILSNHRQLSTTIGYLLSVLDSVLFAGGGRDSADVIEVGETVLMSLR